MLHLNKEKDMCAINRNTRGFRIFSKIQISFAGNRAKVSLYYTYTGIDRAA